MFECGPGFFVCVGKSGTVNNPQPRRSARLQGWNGKASLTTASLAAVGAVIVTSTVAYGARLEKSRPYAVVQITEASDADSIEAEHGVAVLKRTKYGRAQAGIFRQISDEQPSAVTLKQGQYDIDVAAMFFDLTYAWKIPWDEPFDFPTDRRLKKLGEEFNTQYGVIVEYYLYATKNFTAYLDRTPVNCGYRRILFAAVNFPEHLRRRGAIYAYFRIPSDVTTENNIIIPNELWEMKFVFQGDQLVSVEFYTYYTG